jgi:peptide/nickel transport system permease protein
MVTFLSRRLAQSLPLWLGITVIAFLIINATPGGPLSAYEANPNISPEDIRRLEHAFGLDQPLWLRYLNWLTAFVHGDWGYSYASQRPVLEMIRDRLPNTLVLMACVYLFTILIAIPIGMYTALRQYSVTDHIVTGFTFAGLSTPTFWLGLLLIIVFGLTLRVLPLGGLASPFSTGFDLVDRLQHLVLPVATLSYVGIAHYTRYLRASMLETLSQEYIRTARAKGLLERLVVLRHAFRNAAIPLVTVAALDLPELFAGALVTEQIFGWPGMGRLFWDAATRSDYPVLMGILTVSSAMVIAANLLADLVYGYLDPRIRRA